MSNKQDCKVFVGGLSWETTDQKLRMYFENYGNVTEAFVNYDRNTGRPRGFGFVVFDDPTVADKVVLQPHTIDRREVEAKKAVPKEEHQAKKQGSEVSSQRSKKVFVGGLAPTVDEKAFREYFEQYGSVKDAVVMYDHENKRPRGFGFVTFQDDESVAKVFANGVMQTLHDKKIEIKHAVPRDQMAVTRSPVNLTQRTFATHGAEYVYPQSQFSGLTNQNYQNRTNFQKYGGSDRPGMLGSLGPGVPVGTGTYRVGSPTRGTLANMQLNLGATMRQVPHAMASNISAMPTMAGFGGMNTYANNLGYGMSNMLSFSNSGMNGIGTAETGFSSMNGYGQQPLNALGSGSSSGAGQNVSSNMGIKSFGHSPGSAYGGFSPGGQMDTVSNLQTTCPLGTVEGDFENQAITLNNTSAGTVKTDYSNYESGAFSDGPVPGWSH